MYTVKEAAQLLGIAEHTVRYYTDQGLIPDLKRADNNYRLFDEAAMDWLRGTVYFRELGLSIRDIIHFHDLCISEDPGALDERYEMIKDYHRRALEDLKKAQKRVQYMEKALKNAKEIADHTVKDARNPRLKYHRQK